MAADPTNFQELLNSARAAKAAGIDPSLIRSLGPQAVSGLVGAKERMADVGPQLTAASQALEKKPLGRMSTLGTAGVMATGKAMQGDLMGALSQGLGGLGGGAVASALVNNIKLPGPLGVAAKIGAPIVGAMAGGNMLEAITGGIGAKATEASASPSGPDISIGPVPLTEAARIKQQQERDIAMEVKRRQSFGGADLALDKERLAMQTTDDLQRLKGQLPYIQQLKNQELVRAQALNASNTANSLALGRQAGSFGLAKNSQTNAAEIFKTALAYSPYANAGMAQPSLSYNIG